MIALMHDAEGVGLAATQVGILRRFFVCTLDGEDRLLVNPVVTPLGDDTESDAEGCLSLGTVRVPVERVHEGEARGAGRRRVAGGARARGPSRHGWCSTRSTTSTAS